jgi:hypothetical protein
MEIKTFFGVPAHPLFIHLAAVGIPIAALAVITYLVFPAKRSSLRIPTAVLTIGVMIGTVLTASSGEQLEEMLPPDDRSSSLLHHHTQLGDQTQTIVIVFTAVALLFLALDWWQQQHAPDVPNSPVGIVARSSRIPTLVIVAGIGAVILGSIATVWDVRTGHAGAKSAWGDVATSKNASSEAINPSDSTLPRRDRAAAH